MLSCVLCKFKCTYESDYKRHLNTKKHKENLGNKNLCDGCFKEFSTKSNKNRHEKSCKIIQTINNTNIETQNNTTNNITNNTNIISPIIVVAPNDPKALETFMMYVKELQSKQTTDCFQKLLLNDMTLQKHDLMDYIEKFDTKLNEVHEDMINDHNMNCKETNYVNKIDENGEKYIEKTVYTPLKYPDYKFDCKHANVDFKLNEDIVSKILTETILDVDDKIVVTHDNDVRGKTDLLFKYRDTLHTDEILLEFLSKSNKKEICNLSNDFKPASIIKLNYPEYYDKLEEKAINIIQAYSKKTKRK
jgi:Zinc-finger of C2H2 type